MDSAPVLLILSNDPEYSEHPLTAREDDESVTELRPHHPTIRFLAHHHVFRGGAALHDLLSSGKWEDVPVWTNSFGPGASR
jgi:hypothetical protein